MSILSNEKYRGVRFHIEQNSLRMMANNPEQEEAEEEIKVNYEDETLSLGFNVGYFLDALSIMPAGEVQLAFKDSQSSVLLKSLVDENSCYVVMPLRTFN